VRVLITGGKGQLGNDLKSSVYEREHSNPGLDFTFIDIEDLDLTNVNATQNFFSKNSFDLVINCAAYTAVDKAQTDEKNAEIVNADIPKNLAKLSNTHKFNIIHISTDFVFDGKSNRPYVETDYPSPLSIYGITKLKGEEHIINESYGAIVIRTSWLYSKHGNNFVKTISRIAKERGEIRVIDDQVGSPTNAKNLADAIMTIVSHPNLNFVCKKKEIVHFCNSGETSWHGFAKSICENQKIECNVIPIPTQDYPTPAKRPQYSVMNCSHINELFNIEQIDWRIALKAFFSF